MEDPSFNLKGIHIVNLILNYFYLGLLIMCFILALGNRPQGAKWFFTTAFLGFALITVYMTVGISSPRLYHSYSEMRLVFLKRSDRCVLLGIQGH